MSLAGRKIARERREHPTHVEVLIFEGPPLPRVALIPSVWLPATLSPDERLAPVQAQWVGTLPVAP